MPKTKIQAARGGFSEMQRLFESAQYRGAAELYDRMIDGGDRPANDAVLLRARLYLKTDSKEIVPFLLREELRKPTQAQAARRSMYLGTGYSRLGDFGEADKHFAKAKSVLREGAPLGELAAHITRRYLDQRDFESAEAWQRKSLTDRSLRGRVRSEHLASYVLARRERYREQAESVIKVLDLIGNKRQAFAEDWFCAVHTLAGLARELPFPEAAMRAKAEVDVEIEWPSDLLVSRLQALKGVAWCQASCGGRAGAVCATFASRNISTSSRSGRATLYLDRSYFASIVGEHQWASNELTAAAELAEGISWDETPGRRTRSITPC